MYEQNKNEKIQRKIEKPTWNDQDSKTKKKCPNRPWNLNKKRRSILFGFGFGSGSGSGSGKKGKMHESHKNFEG